MDLRQAALVAMIAQAACSGKAKAVEDARRTAQSDAPVETRADPSTPPGKGDVQIRVEWKDVPVVARASPGRTTCGTARPGAVAPTTTWGIPDVIVELAASSTPAATTKRIVVEPCAVVPRVAVAHELSIASAAETPAKITLQQIGKLPLGGAATAGAARAIYLPIAGHEVVPAVEAGGIYVVKASDEATVVVTDSPYVAITEATGTVVMRAVPTGTHAVTAYLPARSGQPARVARGKVTVNAGALAEVTLDISAP